MRTQKKGTQMKRAAVLSLLFVFVYAGCKQVISKPMVQTENVELTLTQSTANGSVSATVDGNPLTFTENKAQVEKGKTVVFTAAPADGTV